jgi:D-alanyl-D-alanine carboxypeptidase
MIKTPMLAIIVLAIATACAAVPVESAAAGSPLPSDLVRPDQGGMVAAASEDPHRLVTVIDSIALAAVESGEVIGMSVAALKGGEIIRTHGYGMADLESRAPASDSTRYHIGSITKPITAAAILRLADGGHLRLDDDVTRYVPELGAGGTPITLRHLLTHTSGLAGPQQVGPKFIERRHLEFSRGDLLELLQDEPRVSEPGAAFAYNNLGYIVLGIIAERVSGQSFEEHIREGVLAPAAATSTLLCDTRRIIPHRARGYEIQDGVVTHHEPVNASLVFAAGGLCSTAVDIARWLRALARGDVVTPAAFTEMTRAAVLADGTALPYGYGLFVDPAEGHARVHHGGVVNGFSGHAAHYTTADVTVVVLTNTRGLGGRQIEERIARCVLEGIWIAGVQHAGAATLGGTGPTRSSGSSRPRCGNTRIRMMA